MSEKKEAEPTKDEAQAAPVAAPVPGGGPAVTTRRSDTEQAIIDTLGTDPSKYKEGTREHDLVQGLPENIAKKREEEEKKKKQS